MKKEILIFQRRYLQTIAVMIGMLLSFSAYAQFPSGSPVAVNGKLSVAGGQLVNECGNPVQLRGMSTHGVQWFQNCYNDASLDAMVNDWGIDIFRIAMYVEDGGYVNNPTYWKNWIDNMVNECAERGIYVMIDWHVLHPGDPWENIDAARDFWSYMSAKHAGKEHVLYEIANEPNGVGWPRVKSYAEDIIPRIRANDPTTVVIVGTPNWSQDVDIASADPLNFDNLMYTLHFYSGTHTNSLRQKGNTALANGAALFVTEFGTSMASGDGGPYLEETQRWMDWMAQNKISWANWSFADKAEVSAALASGACSGGNWNSTSQSGTFIKDHILNPADNFNCGQVTTSYTVSASAGSGGSITPNGSVKVNEGANQSFAISAGSGYKIEDVLIDGASVGAVATYTFSNVQANHSITASFSTSTSPSTQQAFGGTPRALPGAVEAVHFDTGGEGVAYHDTSVGNAGNGPRSGENVDTEYGTTAGNVGWIEAGEWLEYTVAVAEAGNYDIEVQVASSPGGGAYHIEFKGADVTGTKTVGATGGWASFTTQTISGVSLSAGEQVMRVYMEGGSFNIARMSFTLNNNGGSGGEVNNPPTAIASATPLSGTAPLEVSFNASTSSDPDGDALSYRWNFGDGTTGIGATPKHTYTAANNYIATVTVSDGNGGTDQASVNISVSSGNDNNTGGCDFGTPRASALPSVNQSYNYVYVLGSGGPDLSNVTSFTINWDLPNRGLWQFSMNTNNGSPSWFVDLLGKVSHTFAQAQPAITIAGSGFPGLDGKYNVNLVDGNFVMVSLSGDYTVYFSKSATRPVCSSSATMANHSGEQGLELLNQSEPIEVFPNPFTDEITIKLPDPESVENIVLMDAQGKVIRSLGKGAIKRSSKIKLGNSLSNGLYLIQVKDSNGTESFKIIKQ